MEGAAVKLGIVVTDHATVVAHASLTAMITARRAAADDEDSRNRSQRQLLV
jgi:hypothetical protein